MSLNIVAIKRNGMTITAQKETVSEAVIEVRTWIQSPFYNNPPIVKVFFGDDKHSLNIGLSEFSVEEICDAENWAIEHLENERLEKEEAR